ncbi:MAG: hypothetical protein HY518_00865 [Candidatus Aenigmarchaeota archaeon]|nr:hypothetical protein [Candidatus Aenigmarchaeota archaeon]
MDSHELDRLIGRWYCGMRESFDKLIVWSSYSKARRIEDIEDPASQWIAEYKREGPLWVKMLELDPSWNYRLFERLDGDVKGGRFDFVKADVAYASYPAIAIKRRMVLVPKDRPAYPFDGVIRHTYRGRLSSDAETANDIAELDFKLGN